MPSPPNVDLAETPTTRPTGKKQALAAHVIKIYRRMAPVYNWAFGLSLAPGRRAAVRSLNVRDGDRLLEVGVGTGLALPLWPRQAETIGIDPCAEMLGQAVRLCKKHNLQQVKLLSMDAQQMSFPDNHFDKIAAMYVVSVVPDPAALMREIARVGRPGAQVVLINHFAHRGSVLRWLEQIVARAASACGWDLTLEIDVALNTPGLRILDVRPANWFGYWTLILAEVE